MSNCSNAELLRDYAFDELPAAERPAFERHLAQCAECAAELDQLRLTTAALRILPDVEPPQRIAFVSDRLFAPSRLRNFAPWLGFASAAVMAIALVVSARQRPVEVRTVAMQPAPIQAAPVQPVNEEVIRKAVAEAQREDARIFKAALATIEAKQEREQKNLIDAMNVIQAHTNLNLLASIEPQPAGAGQ